MMGMVAALGTPFAPWHAPQTCNLAPNSRCVFGFGVSSAAVARAANAATRTRTPATLEKRLLIIFYAAPCRVSARPVQRAFNNRKHAALRVVVQAAALPPAHHNIAAGKTIRAFPPGSAGKT